MMKKLILIFILGRVFSASAQLNDFEKKNMVDSAIKTKPILIADNTINLYSQSELFNEVNPSGFDLFNTNLSFTDKDQIQKIGFSPFRMIPNWYSLALSNFRLNITNKSGALTTGFSFGYDGSSLDNIKAKKIENTFNQLSKLRARNINETVAEYTIYYRKEYRKRLDSLIEVFDTNRLRHVFKASFGYNAQFFSVLSSKSTVSNFDSLNYHGFKGNNLFLNLSYAFSNGSIILSSGYNYFNKRKSADSTQTLNRYDGFSFGISKRIIKLVKDSLLKKKDYYINTRFIPAILVGVSYDKSSYLGQNYLFAEDNAKNIKTVSPFIDFAIDPNIQFRLIFPLKTTREFNNNSDVQKLNSIFQLNYKLVNLK